MLKDAQFIWQRVRVRGSNGRRRGLDVTSGTSVWDSERITFDGSERNGVTVWGADDPYGTAIIRQVKYLGHVVEQDHEAVKRSTRAWASQLPVAAQYGLSGIELMHRLQKGYMIV